MSELSASMVDTCKVIRSNRPTTLAFVKLSNGHASYSFFDENSAGRMITPHDMPPMTAGISALYFGGISLACDPGADAYRHIADQHSKDYVVMIDPNIRTDFINDENRYRARLNDMITLSDIVKVSDEDLNWIIPTKDSLDDKAKQLLQLGPSIVILTRGSSGARAWLADGQSVSVPSRTVDVVDTVGAGDSFNAGVLASLSDAGFLTKPAVHSLSKTDIKNAIEFGAKVAAVNVSRAGANPPWRDELASLEVGKQLDQGTPNAFKV